MKIKTRKPTAYIICGFIGSGKTTFAKKLEQKTGAVRITKDEWMIKIFGNTAPIQDKFSEYDNNVIELSRSLALQLLKHGNDVIIDEGFWAKSQREEMRRKVEELGATAVLYYVKCPMEIMKKRTLERSRKPDENSFEISEEMFNRYANYWTPPTISEKYTVVSE